MDLLQPERYKKITDYLQVHNTVKVTQLAEFLDISIDTVRRDLEFLESQGALKRVHGGAVYNNLDLRENSYGSREIKNRAQKQELAEKITSYISEGQVVAINSGTTNIEVAKKLAGSFKRLTVITNGLRIVGALAGKQGFTVIVPGGVLDHEEYSLHGIKCEQEISQYNIDIAIITVNAISLEKGLTDFRINEVGIINSMMTSARKTLITADSSKFDTISFINVCSLDKISMIITDSGICEEMLAKYRQHNVEIV